MMKNNKVYKWLLNRADRQVDNIWIFAVGTVLFFFGVGVILYSESTLTPSVGQEIIVLIGFILAIIGGITAIIGYLSLSLLRFLRFTTGERIKPPSADSPTDTIEETGESQKKSL